MARFLHLTPTFRDNSTNIVCISNFYTLVSVKINLSLLSQQSLFLCVSHVNFPHFEFYEGVGTVLPMI